MKVAVNGEVHDLPEGSAVPAALAAAGLDGDRRVAVARNGEVVPRSAWESETLADGDRLEVVAAIQGGAR